MVAPVFILEWSRDRAARRGADVLSSWESGRTSATIRPSRPPPSVAFYWVPRQGFLRELARTLRLPFARPRAGPLRGPAAAGP